MDIALWALQIILGLVFLGAGAAHVFDYERASARPRMDWMRAVGRDNMRIIGVLEILGAVGLVLPGVTGIVPWLTPLAAALLGLLMVFAAILHLRREHELPNVAINVVLGAAALAVAIGRAVVEPF